MKGEPEKEWGGDISAVTFVLKELLTISPQLCDSNIMHCLERVFVEAGYVGELAQQPTECWDVSAAHHLLCRPASSSGCLPLKISVAVHSCFLN